MTQRKKFLYVGLGLNLLFFVAVGIAIIGFSINRARNALDERLGRFLQIEQMMIWDKQITASHFLENYYAKKWTPAEAGRVASAVGITAVVADAPTKYAPLIPDQPKEPVPIEIFDSNVPVIVFHSQDKHLFLTFLLTAKQVPGLPFPHTVTVEQPLLAVPEVAENLKSQITVLEKSWSGPMVLYSSFPEAIASDLQSKFTMDINQATASEKEFNAGEVFHQEVTLDKEKYLLYPMYLINQGKFQQVILYSFKIKDFAVIDEFSAAIGLLILLCLSIGLVFMSYAWSRED